MCIKKAMRMRAPVAQELKSALPYFAAYVTVQPGFRLSSELIQFKNSEEIVLIRVKLFLILKGQENQ